MLRYFVTVTLATLAVSAGACGSSDRHAQAPGADSSGGAGPGVTSGVPAEPEVPADVAPAPSTRNPARRPSQRNEELLALRSNLLSEPVAERALFAPVPIQTVGGMGGGGAGGGTGGNAPVSRGGTSGGGRSSTGGALDRK